VTQKIPYTRPSITQLEIAYATDAATTGWGAQCYDYIHRFEAAFKEHLGVDYAIATSSCTGALHLGLAAMGIGPGDEVILADTNWIATAAPIVHLGATPVFIDILPDTWCLDPELIEQAITPRTRAVVATHLYGNLCDMDAIQAVCERHGIPVIEDAAEAIGSIYRGRRAGSMGIFGTFSFHGTKTITTGEGGMFVTNDADLYERVLTMSNHGRSRREVKQFWPELVGYKFKMSNVQAAIGCAQLERVEELVERKRAVLHAYKSELEGVLPASMNPDSSESHVGAWMPTIVFRPESRFSLPATQAAFQDANIDARVFFHPLSALPMFAASRGEVVRPEAYSIPHRSMNLPSFHDITPQQIERVVEVLKSSLEAGSAS
jgi:perosamine synthetase